MSNYTSMPQHNFLHKQHPKLSQNSAEWARIEYLLQLSSGYTSVVVKNIYTISNPHLIQSFEKTSKNSLTLDSWLEVQVLDENNRIEKVCSKGFDFPQTGLRFPTGHIKLSENLQPGRQYELLLLKIAVGKSYCLPDQQQSKEKYRLIQGFDSIYLYNEDEDSLTGTFKHDYILFENQKVLPCYVVQFEIDQKKEDYLNSTFCDICNDNAATIYCKADDMNLCFDCDEEHHIKGGKLVSKHQRVPISDKPKSFGYCQQHNDQKLELFCTIDRTPLCVYCKIGGSHSSGENANHPLVKIQDAFQKALSESREIDPLIEKRKNQLAEYLQKIDTNIKIINQNASQIEEKIYQILKEAISQLQEETQKKMSYLVGDQLELKRQYDQIQWLESFLKYQQEVLNPSDYLSAWSRHVGLRNEILNISNIPQLSIVEPDLRIDGRIQVMSGTTLYFDQNNFQEEQEYLDQQSQIGTTRFRSNIFNKHQVSDKNQKLIKTIIQQNVQKETQQGPQLLLLTQQQKTRSSKVFQPQNDTIQESQIQDSQNSSFAQ